MAEKPNKGITLTKADHSKTYRDKNRKKIIARRKVFTAKRNGKLKQLPCAICGEMKSEAHHSNYSKPLKVVWLCKRHHVEADKGVYPQFCC